MVFNDDDYFFFMTMTVFKDRQNMYSDGDEMDCVCAK